MKNVKTEVKKTEVGKKAKKLVIAKVVSVEAKLSANCPKAFTNDCGINYRSL